MKRKSKVLAISLCAVLICTLIPIGIFASADEPIIINGYQELKNIAKDEESLKGNYKLGSNITFGDEAIIPIGDNDHPFKGTFDGDGHTIKNLKIAASKPTAEDPSKKEAITYVGLFGVVDKDAKITNLKMSNVSFSEHSIKNSYVSYIAGCNKGTIEKCATILAKTRFYNNIGYGIRFGAIAANNEGKISQCYNSCDITNTADVLSLGNIGGIVGTNAETSEVVNCFNTGNIATCGQYNISAVGGIAGRSSGKISKVYNTGLVSGYNSGAVIGVKSGEKSSVENAYYLNGTSVYQCGKDTTGKKSFDNMKNLSSLDGFTSMTWTNSSSSYPFPILKDVVYEEFTNSTSFAGGNGRFYNPYQITNTTQVNKINEDLTACYKLNNDILFTDFEFKSGSDNSADGFSSATEGAFYNENKKWIPIGLTSKDKKTYAKTFTGSLDGDNHTIYNLQVKNLGNSTNSYAGLFAVNGGMLYNLNIKIAPEKFGSDTDEQLKARVAQMIDNNEYSSNSSTNDAIKTHLKSKAVSELATGSLFESETSKGTAYAGSITAYNAHGGRIDNVKNIVNVNSRELKLAGDDIEKELSTSGGITGVNYGLITGSRNEGRISSNSSTYYAVAGGITGSNRGYIKSCENTGTVYTGFSGDIKNINYYFKNVYLASGGIAGKSMKATDSEDNEIVLIQDCKNIGGAVNRIKTENAEDTIFSGAVVGDGQGKISACKYWSPTAKRANENVKDSSLENIRSYDSLSSIGITNYKQDYFFKLDIPDAPSEGYNSSNYQSYLDTELASRAKLYKNTQDASLSVDEITNKYSCVEESKYIQVTAKLKEDASNPNSFSGSYDFIIMLAPEKIIVDSSKAKTVYYMGEEFNDEGLVVTAQYGDGTSQVIHRGAESTQYSVKGFDKNTSGRQNLTISYNGGSIPIENNEYTVDVYEKNFVFKSKKSEYSTGYSFTDKDFVAKVEYGPEDDKKSVPVEYKSSETVDGYEVDKDFASIDTSVASKDYVTIKATYNGKSSTAKFKIVSKPVEPEKPVAVTLKDKSSGIKINKRTNIISSIKAGTKISDFKDMINEGDFVKVYNGNYQVRNEKTRLGTGFVVKLVVDGSTVKQYKIAVTGDVTAGGKTTGDGLIDIVDLVAVRCHILDKYTLKDEYYLAGDINGDRHVDIVDLVKIRFIILGKI